MSWYWYTDVWHSPTNTWWWMLTVPISLLPIYTVKMVPYDKNGIRKASRSEAVSADANGRQRSKSCTNVKNSLHTELLPSQWKLLHDLVLKPWQCMGLLKGHLLGVQNHQSPPLWCWPHLDRSFSIYNQNGIAGKQKLWWSAKYVRM